MSKIVLDKVGFSFSRRISPQPVPILQDLDLHVDEGEFVVLLGPSGCGKSTILNLVAGFERPCQGRVLSQGQPVAGPSVSRGMVFQQPLLYPWLTVMENVTFGPRMNRVPASVYQEQARQLLRQMGLVNHHQAYPWELSGGMKQRVALARAWIMQPEILLMDEPFAALDAQTRALMQELLLATWARVRTTILFVTHDVDEALLLGTRILIMSARPGRICEAVHVPFDTPRDADALLTDPNYTQLKRRVLHRVREEARKHLDA